MVAGTRFQEMPVVEQEVYDDTDTPTEQHVLVGSHCSLCFIYNMAVFSVMNTVTLHVSLHHLAKLVTVLDVVIFRNFKRKQPIPWKCKTEISYLFCSIFLF